MSYKLQQSFRTTQFNKERLNKVWLKAKKTFKGTRSQFIELLVNENVNQILGGSKTIKDIKRNIEEDYKELFLKMAKKGTFKNGGMVVKPELIGLSPNMNQTTMLMLANISKLMRKESVYCLLITVVSEGTIIEMRKEVNNG